MHIEDASTLDLMAELERRLDGMVIGYRRVNNDGTVNYESYVSDHDKPMNILLANMVVRHNQQGVDLTNHVDPEDA